MEKEYVRYRLDQLSLIPQEKKLAVKAEARAILTDLFSRYIKAEADPIGLTGQPEWFKALCRDAKEKERFTRGTVALVELSGNRMPTYAECLGSISACPRPNTLTN